jgi:hypothetical protein
VRGLVCAVVVLITLEACTRIDDLLTAGASPFAAYNELTIYTTDKLGRIGKPFARYLKWQLNSLGYRGPELVPGRIRIACLGASETFGLFESPGNEYPRQLERRLNALTGTPRFDIVNASYVGMNAATHDIRVPYLVQRVHPRYALIYASGANYIWLPWVKSIIPYSPQSPFELRVKTRAANAVARILPDDFKQWRRERLVRNLALGYTVMDTIPEANVERYIADLSRLLSDLRACSVSPILITAAYRFQEPVTGSERYFLTMWRLYYPMLADDGFLDMGRRMNDAVRMLAQKTRTPLIDMDRAMPRGPKYYGDFGHFTDEGATEVGRIISDALIRSSMIAELNHQQQVAGSARVAIPQ